MQMFIRILLLAVLYCAVSVFVHAQPDVDISNPVSLVFAADRLEPFIDVIDVNEGERVFRIETPYVANDIVVTPFAPLLFFTNVEARVVVAYNLREQRVEREIPLGIYPRHMVLDTTGKYIALTDSVDGGMAVLGTLGRDIIYENLDFPPTTDVLFDPNEVDLYYVNNGSGALGLFDLNKFENYEIDLVDRNNSDLTSPTRSLDGRYLYVADRSSGDIYSLNAFSKVIHQTFNVGSSPARPYTTPDGLFLYMLDTETGRFVSIEQNQFTQHADTELGEGIDLVAVGRFDRMNLLLSRENRRYHLYDNAKKQVIDTGEFTGLPISVQGMVDGRMAYVAFTNAAEIAAVDMETKKIVYIPATENGAGAFSVGASNNVCH